MDTSTKLLFRTQSTLRLIELTSESQRQQLEHIFIGVRLIERILIAVIDAPESEFESVVVRVLDEALSAALESIDQLT